ncbi:MAG: FkbM family methyltransferase, partial [Bryobacteraceae bacterium]|nr:FkbM family methyltransferase [Bryobacteraceae bacterium]
MTTHAEQQSLTSPAEASASTGPLTVSPAKAHSKLAKAIALFRVLARIDQQFQTRVDLPFHAKLTLTLRKYGYLFRAAGQRDPANRAPLSVFGRPFYFDNIIGPALLQQMFAEDFYLKQWVGPGATVVDIGANIGQFRLFSFEYLRAARVLSFEPVQRTFNFLSRNFQEDVWRLAVGDSGEITLYVDDNLTGRTAQARRQEADRVERAPSQRLDDIEAVRKLPAIDLLKIDTEGAELDVLRHGLQSLRKSRFLFIETSVDRPCSGDLVDICA